MRLTDEPTGKLASLARGTHDALDSPDLDDEAAWALSRFADYLAAELRERGTSASDALDRKV